MIVNKKSTYSKILIFIFLLFICLITINVKFFEVAPLEIIVTLLLIGLITQISIINCSGKGPTLELMFWIFNFLFNFIAPIAQISNGKFPFGIPINYDSVLKTNLLLLIAYAIFYIVKYNLKRKKKQVDDSIDRVRNSNDKRIININKTFMIIVFLISTIICIYFLHTYGISKILFRSTASTIYGNNQIEYLVKSTIYPAIMSISVIFAIMFYRQKKNLSRLMLMLYLFSIFFITFSPLALSRFRTAALYGAILIYLFQSFTRGNKFLYGFMVAMVVVFPFFSFFRNEEVIKNPIVVIESMANLSDDFAGGDYDAYSTLPLVIEYGEQNGLTNGRQLIGAMLFFVPRTLWANKPIGSGATVAETLNKDFTNVSCQYFAEGYINFGAIGIIIFTILICILIQKMDNYILKIDRDNDIVLLVYNYFVFLLFFVLRGDLLSSFSFTVGTIVIVLLMSYLCNKLSRGKIDVNGN